MSGRTAAGGRHRSLGLFAAMALAGGAVLAGPAPAQTVGPSGYETGYAQGYWLVGGGGGVFSFGSASYQGRGRYPTPSCGYAGACVSTDGMSAPPVGIAAMSKASGYWLGAKDGTVYGIGKGQNSWPAANFHPAAPIAGIAAAATGGYWLAGADGGVFSGNAPFYGSAEPDHPSAPIVAIAATPDGAGYWLLGADGGVFSFGDAGYHGRAVYDPVTCYGACAAPSPLPPPEQYSAAQPVGMASTPDGGGYWIAQSDGAVLAFGDAESLSTEQAQRTRAPIVGLTAAPTPPYCGASSGAPGSAQFVPAPPQGYWLVGADGGVFSYGDAQFEGSAADERLVAPIVGMAAQPVSVACPATRRTRSAGSDAQLSGGGLRPRQQAALGTE